MDMMDFGARHYDEELMSSINTLKKYNKLMH